MHRLVCEVALNQRGHCLYVVVGGYLTCDISLMTLELIQKFRVKFLYMVCSRFHLAADKNS